MSKKRLVIGIVLACGLTLLVALVHKRGATGESAAITASGQGTPFDQIKPGLFEIVSSARYTPNTNLLNGLQAIVQNKVAKPLPPQTILLPLPLSYRDQVPIGFQLTVDPPEAALSVDVYQDVGDNHVLKVILDDLRKWKTVDVALTATVLVGPSEFDDVPVSAPVPDAWPEEAQPWLAATWCADAKDERIEALAAEIRAENDDVHEIVLSVATKVRKICSSAQGHVQNLTAVEALNKVGSCTSNANLFAALLRAAGVPTRVLSGYPTWFGPLQTHYIVEVYVPDYGWFPVESTLCQSPWPNTRQLNMAIVPPEYEVESLASFRYTAAGGVPYLSLTELPDNTGAVAALGTVDSSQYCDHQGRMIRSLTGTPEEWARTLAWARPRWQTWLAADHKLREGQLRFGTQHIEIVAGSVGELEGELAAD